MWRTKILRARVAFKHIVSRCWYSWYFPNIVYFFKTSSQYNSVSIILEFLLQLDSSNTMAASEIFVVLDFIDLMVITTYWHSLDTLPAVTHAIVCGFVVKYYVSYCNACNYLILQLFDLHSWPEWSRNQFKYNLNCLISSLLYQHILNYIFDACFYTIWTVKSINANVYSNGLPFMIWLRFFIMFHKFVCIKFVKNFRINNSRLIFYKLNKFY